MNVNPSQKLKSFKKSLKQFFSDALWQEEEKPIHVGKDLNLEELGLYPLNEYFQYDSYDEETGIYHCKNAKGIVCEAEPMDSASDNNMEALYTLLQRTLPEQTILQCLLYASPHLGETFDFYVKARVEHHPLTEKLAQQRAEFWKRGVFNSLIPGRQMILRDYKLLVCLVFDHELDLPDSKIFSLKEQLKGTLRNIDVRSHFVKPERLLQWVNTLLRPENVLYEKQPYYNELTSLSTLLASPHRQKRIFSDHILIDDGEWQIRNFRVEDYGKQSLHLAQMSDLIGHLFEYNAQIGCPFSLSFIVKICKASEENGKANRLSFRALQRAEMIGKFSPKAVRDANDARAIVSEIEKSERLALVSFNINLYCKTAEAPEHESSLMNVFQSSHCKWKIIKNFQLQGVMLLAHLPLGQNFKWLEDMQKLGLLYKVWVKNAAGMLPMVAEPKGMNNPRLMLTGRRGQIFFFDPFGNPRANYNTCVAGIPGAGKSVTVQEIVSSLIGTGGRVFIIDVGRSYKKFCEILNGEFIEFNKEHPICLNPFSAVNDVDEFLGFMTPFVCSMINPNGDPSPLEISYISKAIKTVADTKGRTAGMSEVADWLLEQEDSRAQDIGKMLYPFTREGQYGSYFNGPATISFNNPMVVFELEEISGNKRFQSVIFMLLMYQVTEKMLLGGRKQQISLIIDEAWDMLKGGQGSAIIENIARRARKYKGALITITQGLNDYFASSAGEAAYINSYWKIIHMQNPEAVEMLIENKKLNLNEFQKRLLCSVTTEHGVYSEMVIKGDSGECILGRLFLDPFSCILYSTQAKDFEDINNLRAQGIPLAEAIAIVAEQRFKRGES